MRRKIRYSDEAIDDLSAIRRWQTQPGAGIAAFGRLRAIRAAISALMDEPCRYPVADRHGLREMAVAGHCVVYAVVPDTGSNADSGNVFVVRVFGPGQSRHGMIAEG